MLGYDNLSAGFWTLCIEMQFYLLFCLLLAVAQAAGRLRPGGDRSQPCRRLGNGVGFFAAGLASLWWFNLDHQYENWIIFFFSMFFLGSLVWWTLERRVPAWLLAAYVGVIVARLAWVLGSRDRRGPVGRSDDLRRRPAGPSDRLARLAAASVSGPHFLQPVSDPLSGQPRRGLDAGTG